MPRQTLYEAYINATWGKRIAMLTGALALLTAAFGAANFTRAMTWEMLVTKFGEPPYMSARYEIDVVANTSERLYRRLDNLLYLIGEMEAERERLKKLGQDLPPGKLEQLRAWRRELDEIKRRLERLGKTSDQLRQQ